MDNETTTIHVSQENWKILNDGRENTKQDLNDVLTKIIQRQKEVVEN